MCRKRIHEEFKDGDSCTVFLKDRFKKEEEAEATWYARAFGNLRNLMHIDLTFNPPTDLVPINKFAIFAQLHYSMFPEFVE